MSKREEELRLEREWRDFITKSKRKAIKGKRKPPNVTFLVQSRSVTVMNPQGEWLNKARWGKWENWNDYTNNSRNLKMAIKNALRRLNKHQVGTVIYVRVVVNRLASDSILPIWQAKWGGDGFPFVAWKRNPVAEYWKRRV
tara:strand:- start:421 stop:843 length:423 start_codon:yes stop_codon:yes gene_type:complete